MVLMVGTKTITGEIVPSLLLKAAKQLHEKLNKAHRQAQ